MDDQQENHRGQSRHPQASGETPNQIDGQYSDPGNDPFPAFCRSQRGQQNHQGNRPIQVNRSGDIDASLIQMRKIVSAHERVGHLKYRCDHGGGNQEIGKRPELLLGFYHRLGQKKQQGELDDLITISEHQRDAIASCDSVQSAHTRNRA